MIRSLKPLAFLAIPIALALPAAAQTTTAPVGVVKITIEAAPEEGASKLSAISATLRHQIAHQGVATGLGTYAASSQTLESGVTDWSSDQWTATPHLCYIENTNGAEEAYLITDMNAATGQLTLSTSFNLTARYSATPTYRIVQASTLASIFANLSTPFHTSDRVYVWNGSSWDTFLHLGGFWRKTTAPADNADNTVIFPDEGIFVLRSQTTPITITLNGSVPTATQVSTLPGPAVSFISSRYPVGTTLDTSGINDANWTSSDRLYLWNGASWDTYLVLAGTWRKTTAPTVDAGATVIDPDSAIFLSRTVAVTPENGAITQPKPYQ